MKAYSFRQSKKLWREASEWIAGGTQGTRQPLYPEYPTYFARAKGCRMWDVDDNEFIDLLCSIGPIILGYAYKRVDDAAVAIIRDSFQSSSNHPIQLELARLLVEMVPCAERVRFLKTGTEATLAAARLARCVTGRVPIARHGYHGWADIWKHAEGFPEGQGGVHQAAGEVVHQFGGTAEGLEQLFKKSRQKFAAVILCPADTRPFTPENYQGIIDVAHQHGALVIFDEVKTGFRVALGGAQELLGVTPDLTTLSKGMANGYPLSAIVGKAAYMERMSETPTAGTFSVEALSIAAAVATLKELKEKRVVDHLFKVGQRLIDGLNSICLNHDMEEPKAYPAPVPSMPRFTWHPNEGNRCDHPAHQHFFSQCLRYGLFFCPWHVAFVNYSHKNRDIDECLEICDFVMGKTRRTWKRSRVQRMS
ncbi:MAG: aminotransferase class III-fold pyridoxal phosphate-dependent enzyme [Armatimonadetes bacterium]|nr:aminotransferase class III-fold pyridoxal phosphate-dependent enzyme [Armatimonadota bacterium]